MSSALRVGAMAVGLILAVLGMKGVFDPAGFVEMVTAMQVPPKSYVAGLIRVAAGLVLFFAAAGSRTPRVQRVIGVVLAVLGAATPFAGTWLSHVIRDAWSLGGPHAVRGWGFIFVALGSYLIYANFPPKEPPRAD